MTPKRSRLHSRGHEQKIRKVAGSRGHDDSVLGIRLDTVESGVWRGRLRWSVDREPVYALVALGRVRGLLDFLEVGLVDELRADDVSWEDIGGLLGVSGEAARKRHARREGGS